MSGGTPLTGVRLAESLPQTRLAPDVQLPVRALDLPEEPGQVLVACVLGVLEGDRARVCTLKCMIENADNDNSVKLISGAGHAVIRGPISPFRGMEALSALLSPQPRGDHHGAAIRRLSPWGSCTPCGPVWTGHPHPPHHATNSDTGGECPLSTAAAASWDECLALVLPRQSPRARPPHQPPA
jgi:hypothetical protein